jgi:hypothetical protein
VTQQIPATRENRAPSLRVQVPGASSLGTIEVPLGFDRVIGREASADITWADPMISRNHLRLLHDAQGVWVEDLGSTNGTYVNEEMIPAPRRLRDGDRLRAGQTVATFADLPPPDSPAAELGRPQSVAGACPGCGAVNAADLWFCTRCGREQRRIPVPLSYESTDRVDLLRDELISPQGGIRPAPFRSAMRAGNGGRRVQYNEGLALPTILFRLLMLGIVCAAITVLIYPS